MSQNVTTYFAGIRDSGTTPSTGTLAVNSAAIWPALGFRVPVTGTLSKVKFFVSAVGGTLGAGDITVELYDSTTAGLPSSSLQASTTITAYPVGAAWVEATGFSTSCTADTQYYIVLKNTDASPATNNFTLRWVTEQDYQTLGSGAAFGWNKRHSTDSGGTWTTGPVAAVGGLRLEMSGSVFYGLPLSTAAANGSGVGVYADREYGVKFTTPADAKIRLIGAGARVTITGTPTGMPRFRLYTGDTLTATTNSINNSVTNVYTSGFFTSSQVLEPSTSYRLVLGESAQADASTNRFNLIAGTIDNDADSKALLPFGGWVEGYLNSTWADVDTQVPFIWLILDKDDPYDASSSGGGEVSSVFG
jgi:hypothetical protein